MDGSILDVVKVEFSYCGEFRAVYYLQAQRELMSELISRFLPWSLLHQECDFGYPRTVYCSSPTVYTIHLSRWTLIMWMSVKEKDGMKSSYKLTCLYSG
jgi:hypothetical protein